MAYRMITGYLNTGSPITLVYLVDQLIVLGFVLARRRTEEISTRIDDWFVGFAGTFMAMMFSPASGALIVPVNVIVAVMIGGLLIHLAAKLTLRRSFGVVAANRGVKSSGPYRLVRHPMYTGYMLSQTAFILAGPTLNNSIVLGLCWGLYLWRIGAEERVLRNDPSYASLPGYKLLPWIY